MTDRKEMEAVLEAILFVSGEPVPHQRLLTVFDEGERSAAEAALADVLTRYAPAAGRGIVAEEVAGGVRLMTPPELHGWLKRFFEAAGSHKLSMAALETLAIVAYRQPITGPEVQELRGVNSAAVLKTLLERRLLRITGRREVVGKPFVYATTREFLMRFGLKDLHELPPLEEFEETFGGESDGGGDLIAGASGRDREEQILAATADLAETDERETERAEQGLEAAPAQEEE